jgi:hypothetical protein
LCGAIACPSSSFVIISCSSIFFPISCGNILLRVMRDDSLPLLLENCCFAPLCMALLGMTGTEQSLHCFAPLILTCCKHIIWPSCTLHCHRPWYRRERYPDYGASSWGQTLE